MTADSTSTDGVHDVPKAGGLPGPKLFTTPRPELERRWGLVRERLRDLGAEALVVQGYEDKIGGSVKWLTDVPAGYPRAVIFHLDDLMTVVDSGANGRRRSSDGSEPTAPGIGEVITTWAFQAAHYTGAMNAGVVVEEIRRRGYRRVALAGTGLMPHAFVSTLHEGLSGVEILDETEFLDGAKARKSAEELRQIRAVAATQDDVFALVLDHIRPGMRDFEVNAFIDHQLQLRGAERGTFVGRSAPMGMQATFGYRHLQGRRIGAGDYITFLLESNGHGGQWTEIARTICFGSAPGELRDGFALCVEAQARVAKACVPGAFAADLARANNEFLIAHGGVAELRLLGHGQGCDMVERPLLREDETMQLQAGANIAIHPTHPTPTMLAHICDQFVIDVDGHGEFVHQTPKQLFEL